MGHARFEPAVTPYNPTSAVPILQAKWDTWDSIKKGIVKTAPSVSQLFGIIWQYSALFGNNRKYWEMSASYLKRACSYPEANLDT